MKKISVRTINNIATVAVIMVIGGAFAFRFYMKNFADTGIRPLPTPKYKEIKEEGKEPLTEKYETERREKEEIEKQATYQIPQGDLAENPKKISNVKFSKLTKAGNGANGFDLVKKLQKDPLPEEKTRETPQPVKRSTTYNKKQPEGQKTGKKQPGVPAQSTAQDSYDPFSTILAPSVNQQTAGTPGLNKRYKAVIYGKQEIGNNSAVEIKLLEDVEYNGIMLHYNSRLAGQAVFGGDRVNINITSVRTSKGEFIVSGKVLDNDGLEGLEYKSGVEKNLEKDKDNLISRVARKSNTYGGEMIGELADQVNESIVNENLKPLKKEDYPVYIEF